MKCSSHFRYALAVVALALVGCGSGPAPVPTYSIFKRREGTGGKSVYIEVPPSVSKEELLSVGKDVEAKEKVAGKTFRALIFPEGHKQYFSERIADYSDGEIQMYVVPE